MPGGGAGCPALPFSPLPIIAITRRQTSPVLRDRAVTPANTTDNPGILDATP